VLEVPYLLPSDMNLPIKLRKRGSAPALLNHREQNVIAQHVVAGRRLEGLCNGVPLFEAANQFQVCQDLIPIGRYTHPVRDEPTHRLSSHPEAD
jgi:hypothetical protein